MSDFFENWPLNESFYIVNTDNEQAVKVISEYENISSSSFQHILNYQVFDITFLKYTRSK